jgi:hypothetical protein
MMALSAAHRRRSAFLPLDQPGGRSRIEQVAARSGRMIVSRATVSARSAGEDALCRLGRRCRAAAFWRQRRRRSAPVLIFAVWALFCAVSSASATQRFRADEWVTECGGNPDSRAADCSITVPFWQTGDTGKGSFALVVMLETGNIGIVGQPFPVKAVLRVDKNPSIECQSTRYCIFPSGQSFAAVRELGVGSLVLIDVFTPKSHFAFSLTTKGYQAGVAQIRAWGYRLPTD